MVWDRPSRWDESTDPKPEDTCISPEECQAHQACALTSKGGCSRKTLPVDWGTVNVEDGMTDAEHSAALSSRLPSLEGTQHISDKADELIAKYAESDDAGLFLSSLTPAARESVKKETIRQALEVGKQIGALEEREAIVKWVECEYPTQEMRDIMHCVREEKHRADSK